MTREEAIANLNMIRVAFVDPGTKEQRKLVDDTFDMARQALSQEPCDDVVSREAVYRILKEYHIDEEEIESAMDECQNLTVNGIISDVSLLPSVTHKSGKRND